MKFHTWINYSFYYSFLMLFEHLDGTLVLLILYIPWNFCTHTAVRTWCLRLLKIHTLSNSFNANTTFIHIFIHFYRIIFPTDLFSLSLTMQHVFLWVLTYCPKYLFKICNVKYNYMIWLEFIASTFNDSCVKLTMFNTKE